MPIETPQGALDQFLQPQSMITPGALGGIAMLGTNSIAANFPYMSLPLTACLLSGLFGLAAIVKSTSISERLLYYVLNSIIIFSVASGSNKIGQQLSASSLPSLAAYAAPSFVIKVQAPTLEKPRFFREWFSSKPTSKSPPDATRSPPAPPDEGTEPANKGTRRPDVEPQQR